MMGTAERRTKEKEELRALILEIAKELFLTKGIEHTTIRNIATKISYSVGTVYVYFKDKNEILFEINTQGFVCLRKAMEPAMNLENPIEQLYQIGRSYLEFALNNKDMYDLMFIMNAPMDYLSKAHNHDWCEGYKTYEMLNEVIRRCVNTHCINGDDIASLSFAYWSLVHGLAALSVKKRLLAIGCKDESVFYAYDSFIKTISKTE